MRHKLRTHLTESMLDPKIQIKYVDTKNQLADPLTKGSFTRDEWDHLCQPLSFIQKAECHIQGSSGKYFQRRFDSGETETIEFGVKEPRERGEKHPQDSSDSNSPANQELDQSCVSSSGRNLTRNINQNPTMYSQERQRDDTQSSSTRKLGRRDEP